MLLEFSVENFLSFKEKTTFSMEASFKDDLTENVANENGINVLKTAAIYGSNASGKTNFIKAISSAVLMVRNSNYIGENGSWKRFITPFAFSKKTIKQPTKFWFTFIANNIRYNYYFSCDHRYIYEESLEAYYSQKPTLIFKRTDIENFEFNSDKKILEDIAKKNTKNKLFLATATTWNYEKTKDAFDWFYSKIETFFSFNLIKESDLMDYTNTESNLKEFAIKILNEADIQIRDISVSYKTINQSFGNIGFDGADPMNSSSNKLFKVDFIHTVEDEDGNKEEYLINISNESEGTKCLFNLIPFLKRAFENKSVLVIDELERSLHPLLIEFLIKLFNNKKINTFNSQLIFTTHASNLLTLDLFRRDQIWFTEKNEKTGATDLYPLDSFSIRKDENILKGYLNGRYGAVPYINDNILWQEESSI